MKLVLNSPLFINDTLEVEAGINGVFFAIYDGDKEKALSIVVSKEDRERLEDTFREGLKGMASSDFNSPLFLNDTITIKVNGRSFFAIYDGDFNEFNTIALDEEDTLKVARLLNI